jgi:formylglycine-generating enzyme required for sulfatase activity
MQGAGRLALAPTLLAALAAAAAEPPAAPGSIFRDCEGCPEMVVVPAGSFVMGTPQGTGARGPSGAEKDTLVIELARPFALGRHELTRGEFARFISESGYEPDAGCRVWDASLLRFSEDPRRDWRGPAAAAAASDDQPVACVSFTDALAYVSWLSQKTGERYRLPSEAEWEYAARAGTRTRRPWGDDAESGCDHANTYDLVSKGAYRLGWPAAACRDGQADVAPVGQFAANAFGLHDMIGNVREWVQDCATGSYVGRPRDSRAWEWIGGCGERIQRGGSWLSMPAEARSAHRASAPAGDRAGDAGFRVARDIASRKAEER